MYTVGNNSENQVINVSYQCKQHVHLDSYNLTFPLKTLSFYKFLHNTEHI